MYLKYGSDEKKRSAWSDLNDVKNWSETNRSLRADQMQMHCKMMEESLAAKQKTRDLIPFADVAGTELGHTALCKKILKIKTVTCF